MPQGIFQGTRRISIRRSPQSLKLDRKPWGVAFKDGIDRMSISIDISDKTLFLPLVNNR